jgi:hypothetical protein
MRLSNSIGRARILRHVAGEPAVVEHARHYVLLCDRSLSGHGGHNQLYRVACVLVDKFHLSLTQAWQLLLEFNDRCQPPWSKGELIHKLADAFKVVGVFYDEPDLMVQLPFETCAANFDDGDFIIPTASTAPTPHAKPMRKGFGRGTDEQLQRLADLRRISFDGLRWARDRGVLVFGYFAGLPVFGVTDQSGVVLEIRRLDGKPFPAIGNLSERKSHAVRGSSKRHPVGINEARDCTHIIVCEGVPDFLAAHDLIRRAESTGTIPAATMCAPIALLSANVAIDDAALPTFKGKFVRIFYHNDPNGAGWKGARRWQQQIVKAAAFSCDFFHFNKITAASVKDLNEFIVAIDAGHFGSGHNALEGFWP